MAVAAKSQLCAIKFPQRHDVAVVLNLPYDPIQCAECDNVTNSRCRRLICRPDAERHDHSKERVYPTV